MTDPRTTKAARRGLKAVMDALGIGAYLFALEENGSDYRLRLEYAICSGWYTGELNLPKTDLDAAGNDDPLALQHLTDQLRRALPACPAE